MSAGGACLGVGWNIRFIMLTKFGRRDVNGFGYEVETHGRTSGSTFPVYRFKIKNVNTNLGRHCMSFSQPG